MIVGGGSTELTYATIFTRSLHSSLLFIMVCSYLFQDVKDDYVFECEAGNQKTKLTIFQSLGDPLYYGKIQPCKEDEEIDSQMSPSQ